MTTLTFYGGANESGGKENFEINKFEDLLKIPDFSTYST